MQYITYFVFAVCTAFAYPGSSSNTPSGAAQTVNTPVTATVPTLDDSIRSLYSAIGLEKYDLSYEVFRYGMIGYYSLRQEGRLGQKNLLSIIDFTKASTEKRFYTIDLDHLAVKFYTYVSHGRNTGEDMARSFSNIVHSNQSSLGFYTTAETYIGSKGYSLKLDGMEKGYNDNIRARAVVMHEAEYVSETWIRRNGRLGRSQGCPALPKELSKEVIDVIKNGTAVFAYFNDADYLKSSAYLKPATFMPAPAQEVLPVDDTTTLTARAYPEISPVSQLRR